MCLIVPSHPYFISWWLFSWISVPVLEHRRVSEDCPSAPRPIPSARMVPGLEGVAVPLPPEGVPGRVGEAGRRSEGHLSALVSAAPLQPCPTHPRQTSWFPGSPSARPLTLTFTPGLTGPASVPGGLEPDGQWVTPAQFALCELGAQCRGASLRGAASVHLSATTPSCVFSLLCFAHLALFPVHQLEYVPLLSSDSCAHLALRSPSRPEELTCQGLTAQEAELSRLGSLGPGWHLGRQPSHLVKGPQGWGVSLDGWGRGTVLVGVESRLRGPDAVLGAGELAWIGTGGRSSRVPATSYTTLLG